MCIKLVNYWDKYTEMHGQQNVKKKQVSVFKEKKKKKIYDGNNVEKGSEKIWLCKKNYNSHSST